MHGQITFTDEKNGVTGYLDIGSQRRKPRDYMTGHITQNGQKVVENVKGTYMGHIDFDGERYFDLRHQETYQIQDLELQKCLESEARKRPDLVELFQGNKEVA